MPYRITPLTADGQRPPGPDTTEVGNAPIHLITEPVHMRSTNGDGDFLHENIAFSVGGLLPLRKWGDNFAIELWPHLGGDTCQEGCDWFTEHGRILYRHIQAQYDTDGQFDGLITIADENGVHCTFETSVPNDTLPR